jgi:hypothetical protein
MHAHSSVNIVIRCRYEHPIETMKELADSNLAWVNIHEAWVWSLMDSDDPVSKTLVRHFQVLTEEEMTALSTKGKTAFSLEKLASSKSTILFTNWSNYISRQSNQNFYQYLVMTVTNQNYIHRECLLPFNLSVNYLPAS